MVSFHSQQSEILVRLLQTRFTQRVPQAILGRQYPHGI